MFPLIPRVRVNYTCCQLLKALFTGGTTANYTKKLERELCKYFEIDNVLLTSSGRGSIYMVLNSLPQKKVIVPAYTCKVVIEAAMLAGKEIVYAPIARDTFNMNSLPKLDSDCIVIATHQYGIPCNIDEIAKACKESGAILLEDCAASLGSRINGKLTGTFGDYAIFSFDSSKMVTVPSKGGFIIAKDAQNLKLIADKTPVLQNTLKYKVKHLCRGGIYLVLKNSLVYRCFHYLTMQRKGQMQLDDHAQLDLKKGEFYTHGFYEWQAAIALPQIKRLDEIVRKRQYVYRYYDERISNPIVQKPVFIEESACIRYAVLVKNKKAFYEACLKEGVDMGFSFNHVVSPETFKEEHTIADDVLNLPYYYDISQREMERVVNVVNSIR